MSNKIAVSFICRKLIQVGIYSNGLQAGLRPLSTMRMVHLGKRTQQAHRDAEFATSYLHQTDSQNLTVQRNHRGSMVHQTRNLTKF